MNKRLLYLFYVLFVFSNAFSQDTIVISGSVKDFYTKKALPYANISIQGSYIGTTTNDFGKYSLSIPKSVLPIKLVATYMGYQDTSILISHRKKQNRTFFLYPKVIDINEITVNSEKNVIFGARDYQVLDYLIWEEKILLISYKNKLSKSILVMTDLSGKTLNAIPIKNKPVQLYLDCANKPMLICQSLPYIIHIKDTAMYLQRAYQDKFNRLVKPCVATYNDYLFYKYMGPFDLSVEYYAYNFIENEFELFTRIDDEFQQNLFVYDFNHILISNGIKVLGYNNNYESFNQFSSRDLKEVFQFNMYHHPVYAPLHIYDSSVLIFDHPNGNIHTIDINGESTDSVLIEYEQMKGWVPLVIKDEINQQFYTATERNGIYSFYQIGVDSGEASMIKRVPYSWIEKPLIRDNTLYFLYRRKDKGFSKYLYFEELLED